LEIPFEFSVPVASVKSQVVVKKSSDNFSLADFEEWQAIERDLWCGRGAQLAAQVERELKQAAKAAACIQEFERIRRTYK